jgi:CheY-like chemotaxis protein
MDKSQTFVADVESALHALYDPSSLRRNALVQAFQLEGPSCASSLRQIILDAIEDVKPASESAPDRKAWRAYNVLASRYVEQFSWEDVSRIIGLSVRQLMREDSRAIHILADQLWNRYMQAHEARTGSQPASDAGPSQDQELRWIEQSVPSEVIDVRQTVDSVLQTAGPLLMSLGVESSWDVPAGMPAVTGQGTSLRQALLNVVTAGARVLAPRTMSIHAQVQEEHVAIVVTFAPRGSAAQEAKHDYSTSIDMARSLLGLMGGALDIAQDAAGEVRVCLLLSPVQHMGVLVIDDNADTLLLFRRYLEGTRYPFIGCRDPQQALQLAQVARPRIIILDVMLPGMDGWQLLQRLREHPSTSKTPLIVCSILPEEQLALTLGAAAYLRKPVGQQELLAALDQQVAALGREGHAQTR